MADLKRSWMQTGKSVLLALNDLGASLIDTAKAGYDIAMDWARKDNIHVQAEGKDVTADNTPVEEAPVEEATVDESPAEQPETTEAMTH